MKIWQLSDSSDNSIRYTVSRFWRKRCCYIPAKYLSEIYNFSVVRIFVYELACSHTHTHGPFCGSKNQNFSSLNTFQCYTLWSGSIAIVTYKILQRLLKTMITGSSLKHVIMLYHIYFINIMTNKNYYYYIVSNEVRCISKNDFY